MFIVVTRVMVLGGEDIHTIVDLFLLFLLFLCS